MHFLKTVQCIPVDLKTAWDFFSSPDNLKNITPDKMGFEVTSEYKEDKMYPGMIISYKVHPFLGIPLNWTTEISHVEELKYFVDEQRFGPYKFWHHQHKFYEIEGGVEMVDILHYKVGFGFIGSIINFLIVKRQLDKIFSYRYRKLENIFGKL